MAVPKKKKSKSWKRHKIIFFSLKIIKGKNLFNVKKQYFNMELTEKKLKYYSNMFLIS